MAGSQILNKGEDRRTLPVEDDTQLTTTFKRRPDGPPTLPGDEGNNDDPTDPYVGYEPPVTPYTDPVNGGDVGFGGTGGDGGFAGDAGSEDAFFPKDKPGEEEPFIHPEDPNLPPPTNEDLLDQLENGDLTDAEKAEVRERLKQNFNDPTKTIEDLEVNQEFTRLEEQENEILKTEDFQAGIVDPVKAADVSVTQAQAQADVAVADFEVSLIDPSEIQKATDELAKVDPMKATSVSKHLNGLLEGMEEGKVPLWARPAVTKVEQALAARGISASSIGRDSLFNAIIGAAMPIAQGDAQLEHDANKTNYNAKVQAVLSDVSRDFAAKQFNASSINQKNQFMTQLQAQVDMQNASRKDAMAQFNADAQNKASIVGAQLGTQVAQFNAQMVQQREQFNTNMAATIAQSNTQWRRQINQANTAGENAVNQANVQNAFNLSNQAQTALWQEMRDLAYWDFNASESEKQRQHQLEATILANESLAAQGEYAAGQTSVASRLYNVVLESATNKLKDYLGSLWGG